MSKRFKIDLWIIGPTIFLLILSTTVLRSIAPQEIERQLGKTLLGIVAFAFASQIDYRALFPFDKIFYLFSLLLLIITFFFGITTRGSIRWIQFGPISFQASELVKPLIIISLAIFATKLNLSKPFQLLTFVITALIPVALILYQPDLGSGLVILGIAIAIAFAAGISLKIFSAFSISVVLLLPVMYKILKPYQQERIQAFINPFSDPLGSGYSVIQSIIAVGSGMLMGRGLGHGTQSQLRFLPERHSDFIFASLSEELGFIGAMLMLVSYSVLLFRLLQISKQTQDNFAGLIIIGVFFMIFFQAFVNIGMNIGILPITGITLPLISSGGSSLIAIMFSLGIAHSISIRKKSVKTIEIH